MPESTPNPEAKAPYYVALDGFYALIENNTASEIQIKAAVAALFSETTRPTFNRQKYIDNWAQRHAYDSEGTLLNAGDDSDDPPETGDIVTKKLALLSDVTAFLVANEHAMTTDDQKIELLERATEFFIRKKREDDVQPVLGASVAPYLAHNIEMAGLGVNREERARRGKFIINAMTGRWLIRSDLGPTFRNGMRRALKN